MKDRESLYANIEQKLEVIKEFGALISSLPVVDPTILPEGAPDEVLNQERELLQGFSQITLKNTLPEACPRVSHFKQELIHISVVGQLPV